MTPKKGMVEPPEWTGLVEHVSFTPLCRCTSAAYSEVVLRVSDALLARYGYPSSFYKGRAMFRLRSDPPLSTYLERELCP